MEKPTLIGILSGMVLVWGAIFMGEGWSTFFDFVSFVLVVGGTIAALMVSTSLPELKKMPGIMKEFFTFAEPDLHHYVREFYELSRTARREGLLALDRRLSEVEDALARFGLEMAVDGIEEDEIDSLMRERIGNEMKQRHLGSKFFNNAGAYAPAFGMIGTLIGLIQMLQNLSDPTQIGAGMSVALITTFYGALLANLLFLPMAVKFKTQAASIQVKCEMVRTGVLAIVRGESPSMIEKRLQQYVEGEQKAAVELAEASTLSKAA